MSTLRVAARPARSNERRTRFQSADAGRRGDRHPPRFVPSFDTVTTVALEELAVVSVVRAAAGELVSVVKPAAAAPTQVVALALRMPAALPPAATVLGEEWLRSDTRQTDGVL